MEKDIKDYREKELRSYVIANFLVILIGTDFLNTIIKIISDNKDLALITTTTTFAVFSAVTYIFVFLADALVSSETKDKVVWFRSGRPGESIFTEICKNNKDNIYEGVYA